MNAEFGFPLFKRMYEDDRYVRIQEESGDGGTFYLTLVWTKKPVPPESNQLRRSDKDSGQTAIIIN